MSRKVESRYFGPAKQRSVEVSSVIFVSFSALLTTGVASKVG